MVHIINVICFLRVLHGITICRFIIGWLFICVWCCSIHISLLWLGVSFFHSSVMCACYSQSHNVVITWHDGDRLLLLAMATIVMKNIALRNNEFIISKANNMIIDHNGPNWIFMHESYHRIISINTTGISVRHYVFFINMHVFILHFFAVIYFSTNC